MKRVFAFVLCFALMCSIFPVNSFAAENLGSLDNFQQVNYYSYGQFSDVADDAWYGENVATAYELGLMVGNGSTFNPSGNITIAETIVLACRLHSIYYNDGEEFTQGDPWYQIYVDYALENGIISRGYSDNSKAATRAEFSTILYGALPLEALEQINSIDDGDIPDVSSSASYATAVYTLYNAGILTGNDNYGTFTPDTSIGRNAAAVIVTRLADTSLRKSITLEKAVLSIYLSSTSININTGESKTLTATILPDNATNKSISWSSSDTSVAKVNNGIVTGVGAGTATIIATSSNGVISSKCTVTVTKALPVGAPNNGAYFGFCFAKNSADGIKVCWSATNNSGKTINYYTVRVYFYNSVGDPAYDEIKGTCYRDVKYVGPVAPQSNLLIYSIVGYVPVCSKIVLGEITLEYSDGTSESFWYGYNTTTRNNSIL